MQNIWLDCQHFTLRYWRRAFQQQRYSSLNCWHSRVSIHSYSFNFIRCPWVWVPVWSCRILRETNCRRRRFFANRKWQFLTDWMSLSSSSLSAVSNSSLTSKSAAESASNTQPSFCRRSALWLPRAAGFSWKCDRSPSATRLPSSFCDQLAIFPVYRLRLEAFDEIVDRVLYENYQIGRTGRHLLFFNAMLFSEGSLRHLQIIIVSIVFDDA